MTPWIATHQASLSFTVSQSLLKLKSFELMMPSNHLILCRPLLLLPSVFPSFRVFSNKSALRIRWPKSWRFNFSINPSNEYSGLISFRIDWFDLLVVQGSLKSLLQHHSSKSINSSVPGLLYGPTLTSLHDALPISITNSWSLPKPMSIKSVMPSSHLILCCSLLLLPQSLPASGSFLMSQLFT